MHKARRLDSKLECSKCETIYLHFTEEILSPSTPIVCSSCGEYLGTWGELEASFYEQGGGQGEFQLQDGQIIRRN
jgi:hypothetical protein